jgi:hypothetical protein
MDPVTLATIATMIRVGEGVVSQIVTFIGHLREQSGLTDEQIADLAQKHNDEAKAAIDALGTQSSN